MGKSGKQSLKIVVIGDGAVGKTSLLYAYANNEFPEEYVPTIFDNFVMIGNKTSRVGLWDTAGEEDYDRLRPLSYPGTDKWAPGSFISFFPSKILEILKQNHQEIDTHAKNVPFLLVGTKMDLRDDSEIADSLQEKGVEPVTYQQAEKVRKAVKAVEYVECSAKTRQGVKEVFEEAIKIVWFQHDPETQVARSKVNPYCSIQ